MKRHTETETPMNYTQREMGDEMREKSRQREEGDRDGERWENEQHTGAKRKGRETSSHRVGETREKL